MLIKRGQTQKENTMYNSTYPNILKELKVICGNGINKKWLLLGRRLCIKLGVGTREF